MPVTLTRADPVAKYSSLRASKSDCRLGHTMMSVWSAGAGHP